ncbi:hypothetical protein SLK22_18280, partial [Acinetobacter pittii]|nr:hypothetical protein [Acinetobacter pittii]
SSLFCIGFLIVYSSNMYGDEIYLCNKAQRLCHKMNRRGFQYIVGEDALGRETITVYNPDILVDQKTEDGIATMHDPNKLQEVKRFESPDNF